MMVRSLKLELIQVLLRLQIAVVILAIEQPSGREHAVTALSRDDGYSRLHKRRKPEKISRVLGSEWGGCKRPTL
jgi:hypothetical protein